MATDDHLGEHDRCRNQQDRGDVDEDERAAAACTQVGGELPDVAETDGGADRCENKGQSARPAFRSLSAHPRVPRRL